MGTPYYPNNYMNQDYLSQQELILIIQAYATWFKEKVDEGWDPYIITFMFNHIGANREHRVQRMEDEVQRVYAKLTRYIVRCPRAKKSHGKLPIFMAVPDYPVPKFARQNRRDVTVNDGLHYHALGLVPNESRLRTSLIWHFRGKQHLYVHPDRPLRRVQADLITEDPEYAVQYGMKSLLRRRTTLDDILILPRSASEMRQKRTTLDQQSR